MTIVQLLNAAVTGLEGANTAATALERENLLESIHESSMTLFNAFTSAAITNTARLQRVEAGERDSLKVACKGAADALEQMSGTNLSQNAIIDLKAFDASLRGTQRDASAALRRTQQAFLTTLLADLIIKQEALERLAVSEPSARTALGSLRSINSRAHDETLLDEEGMARLEQDIEALRERIGALPVGAKIAWDSFETIRCILRGDGAMLDEVSEQDLMRLKEHLPDQVWLTSPPQE